MKKVFWALGALVFIALAVVLIVPSVINWNGYKSEISAQVETLTGRSLVIGGDIDVQILPAPSLVANQVALSSINGASSPDLVAVRQIEVRIALAPLLGGNIQVETVRLVEPQIFLEILSDGRTSWEIETSNGAAESEASVGPSNEIAESSGPDIIIDGFEIVDGRVEYVDAATETQETVEDIDLNLVAASLTQGPFQADGSFVARNLRLSIDADVGAIVEARTFPLDLSVGIGGDSAVLNLKGTVLGLDDAPRFRGDLSARSENIGRLVEAITEGMSLPPAMQQALDISGALDASVNEVSFEGFEVDLGGAKGSGNLVAILNGIPRVSADVTIDRIDVDPWLAESTDSVATQEQANTLQDTAAGDEPITPNAATPKATTVADFSLPIGIEATAVMRVGNISMRGQSVRDVVVDAQLASGVLTLNQASLTAPGGTSLSAFGLLSQQDGQAAIDAQVEAAVENVPDLLTWAQVDLPDLTLPTTTSINTAVTGLGDTLSVKELLLKFDDTTVSGAATVVLRDRLAFGATVAVDQLNLDTYLAPPTTPERTSPGAAPNAQTPSTEPAIETSGGQDVLSQTQLLQPLTTFDANIKANVGALTYSGIPVSDITADLGLLNGVLTIRDFSVGNLASVSANIVGTVANLTGMPSVADLTLKSRIANPAEVSGLLNVPLPVPAANIGTPEMTATLNGPLDSFSIASRLSAFAANVSADGGIRPFDPSNMLALDISVAHSNAANFLRRLGIAYQPSGDIGALDLKSKISGGLSALSFRDLALALGQVNINGVADILLTGARPGIKAQLTSGPLRVDPFIPVEQRADRGMPNAVVLPARFDIEGQVPLLQLISTVSDRWSRAPIDLSVLQTLDADIGFSAPEVMYQNYSVEDARLATTLTAGVLDVTELSGDVFGGAFNTRASVDASAAQPQITGVITLGDMQISDAAQSVGVDGATGQLTTRVDVATRGSSLAEWVSSLDGQGGLQVTGVKAKQSLTNVPVIGVTFGPLLQVFELLNSGLGGLIGRGGQTGLGETDISSTFTIADGVVSTQDLRLISNLYQGAMAGDINLPAWNMNVNGQVALDQGLVGALLSTVVRIPNSVPFAVTGDIDQPNVRIQGLGRNSGSSTAPIPGLNRLEEKVPGVGGLIQGILGGGSGSSGQNAPPSQQEPASQPPSQQPPSQQPQQVNPAEQLLRGIFGN